MSEASPDFRRRVAAEKRERMRARLLAATMEVCGDSGPQGVVIDDVIRAAGVSRGAFYRQFASLDEAFAALVGDLVRDIIADSRTVFEVSPDPLVGAAAGAQILLLRAALDPAWARFVSGTNLLLADLALQAVIVGAIGKGRADGLFRFEDLEAGTDLFVGALLAGVRRLGLARDEARGYVGRLTLGVLTGLGAEPQAAAAAVSLARARIDAVGPARLAWWRASAA